MHEVRRALGPDALIVSNKRVNGGVEILATDSAGVAKSEAIAPSLSVAPPTIQKASQPSMSPPPSVATSEETRDVMNAIHSLKGSLEGRIEEVMWSNQLRVNPDLLSLFQSLLAYGFSTALLRAMLKRLPSNQPLRTAMQWVRKELDTHLPVLKSEGDLWQPGVALALVGPTGVGKTTTIAKLAARAVRKFSAENVVLITTDTYRIGAHEQLKIYADLLHIKLHVVQNAQQLRQLMLSLPQDQVVLIDNVGISQRDKYVQDQAAMLANGGGRIRRLLALNAASHGDTLDEVARIYSKDGGSPLAGCIITKVDEASRLGASLDIALRYQLPIHYVSDGQRVPENLRFLSASQLVDMALSKSPNNRALFAPTTADLAALVSASAVQEQAKTLGVGTYDHMLKQILALSSLSSEDMDIELLRQVAGLVDKVAFSSAAFSLWHDSKHKRQLPDLSDFSVVQLRNSALEANELATAQPVLVHHIKQRLSSENAQFYTTVVGAGDGKLLAMPLLQLNDKKSWYTNSGLNQKVDKKDSRFELKHAIEWVENHAPPSPRVHWVEEHNNQLWQQWQQDQLNVMSLVAPSTRCWHIDGHTTPAAIMKGLDFFALNYAHLTLPYQEIAGVKLSGLSFWYAQTPIELRSRGGGVVSLQLYAFQILNTKTMAEVKTFYVFMRLNKEAQYSPEQMAMWLLQHTESKNVLRFVGRAYHQKTLQNFAKQYQLDRDRLLTLAALFGGAAWELEQYKKLRPVNQLLLQFAGSTALRPAQISSSLLKLFNLKDLLRQP